MMTHHEHSATPDVPLAVENLEHSFGSVKVLEGVNLSVPTGQLTAVIGPNGSGKSTLLRDMVGLLTPDDGTIMRPEEHADRSIGFLPQRPTFRPGFSVAETLSFYANLTGVDESVTETILHQVGLSQAANTRVEELSGGMIRLLGLGQAMLGSPTTIVLDEPASGLDPGMRERVFEIGVQLTGENTGVLLTSHDLDLVEGYADRVAMLHQGTVSPIPTPPEEHDESEHESLRERYAAETAGSDRGIQVRRASR